MRIPEETLDEIRARVSIVDVVGRHVALKRSGKNWKGLCPFHAEKTPSFVVNEERGSYHCFGCGEGGSVFRFLMEAEGLTFLEAVGSLAERAGVALPTATDGHDHRRERRERDEVLELLELAARYYRHQLLSGRAGASAREYLRTREISDGSSEAFRLGCAPPGWDNLARYLSKKGADLAAAERAGLVAERRSGGHYDRLRDRLVFPITDVSGRVLSFGGRVLGEGEPKYLNGPESPVFKKGELLYGLHQGAEGLRREGHALIVEGYLDVISLHDRNLPNALATLGTALTAGHIHALRRRVDEAVLVYDGDQAGRQAAFRSLDLFLSEGFPCRAVLLPGGHDPDSFVRGGGDLRRLVIEARPLLDLLLEELPRMHDLSGVEGRLAAVEEVVRRLSAIADPLARDLYCRRVAEMLALDEGLFRERLGAAPSQRPEGKAEAPAPPDPLDRALLACLVHAPECREAFVERGAEAWMRPGPAREAARVVARCKGSCVEPERELLPEVRRVLSEVLVEPEGPRGEYRDVEARIHLRHLENSAARLTRELKQAEAAGEPGRVMELMRKKQEADRSVAEFRRLHGQQKEA